LRFSFVRYRGISAKALKDRVAAVEIPDPGRARFRLKQMWPDLTAGGRACKRSVPSSNGAPTAWAAGELAGYFPGAPIRYRSQWYVYGNKAPVVSGLGIHGQTLHVHRKLGIVIAKVSSLALRTDAERAPLITRAISQIMRFLAGSAGKPGSYREPARALPVGSGVDSPHPA
jgi:hypothetical protein